MSRSYYITTPIYYVNDVPHIGHSYTTIAADVLARFFRAAGRRVHFLTGTDEHGIKIVKAAAEKGVSPSELGDEVVVGFQDLWRDLNISNDDFIRTTEPRHEQRVQALIQSLIEQDDIYQGSYEGWYDEGQEEFITESSARDNDYKSPINKRPLVRYSEQNYFFRLSKYVPALIEHIESTPAFVQPAAMRNEVLGKLKQGVEDLCISRSRERLPWGIAMPNDASHVVYVWIDALSNYYTALGLPEIGDEHDSEHADVWPCDVHLIGKDILWFHAVYWPAMLMALRIPLPRCVFAHGWWTAEGEKMSKTLGNFVSRQQIAEICREYSRDVYRYFLLRAVPFGADGDFSRGALQTRYNTELANGIGNLLSRTVKMIGKYFDGVVPDGQSPLDEAAAVTAAAGELLSTAEAAMEACRFHEYLDGISALEGATNRFIEDTEPFKLAKDDSQRERLASILYTCAEAVRIILLHLSPIMPETAAAALACLGVTADDRPLSEQAAWGGLSPGTVTQKTDPLFPRK